MSLELIRKEYDIFPHMYRDVLQKREFEIIDIRDNCLIARYHGSNKLRAKDFDLEVILKRQDDRWVLNADSRLYCDRAHLALDSPKRMQAGYLASGDQYYMNAKLLHIQKLEYGIAMPESKYKIWQPVDRTFTSRLGIEVDFAKNLVLSLVNNGYEITTEGFSEEELTEFKLPSSGATAHIL